MDKAIDVRYIGTQSAEDLFMTTDGSRKVYVRQPANVDDIVFWYTSTKWQGGYEASAPIRPGITMRVVDKDMQPLFEETLHEDTWNGGSSAEKRGPFGRESLDAFLSECDKVQGLKSHNEWRDTLLKDKEAFNNVDYDDNWLYWDTECLFERTLEKFKDGLGETCYLAEEHMRQKTSGREWVCYKVVDDSKTLTLAICGYRFDDTLLLSRSEQGVHEPLAEKIAHAEGKKVPVNEIAPKDIQTR